ncbi:phosphotransferase enzyme family protein [Gorillibacterium timonense]|uniref:phosphotransferase enzyme family protein n=1 Tax=Gorillibacterium timonense TaxID=1689269 RepID=UPI00071C4E45|nr:phosphotransferase [Gorillibacterium timonense]
MKTQHTGKFRELTFEQQVDHVKQVGRRALLKWGYPEHATMKLLNFTENATFSVEAAGKPKIIMRVHRLDYAEEETILTELQWIMDLKKETDIHLADPISSEAGNYVEAIETPEYRETRYVVCFSFLEGRAPVDSSDDNKAVGEMIRKIDKIPDKITIPLFKFAAGIYAKVGKLQRKSSMNDMDRRLFFEVGMIAGKIHAQSKKWEQPAYYKRMEWDFEGTFGVEWNNFYGESYRSREWLTVSEIAALDRCVEMTKSRLESYGKSPDRYGMIHSDLRAANLLKNGNAIGVLDFDDCGKGWYMYEIAGAVALIEHRPDLEEIIQEIIKGYESVLPISNEDKEEIWTFIMMRRIGMLQSLICRISSVMPGDGEAVELTPEILAFYAKGTVILAKEYMKKYKKKALPVSGAVFTRPTLQNIHK